MGQRTHVSRRLGELRWLAVALTLHLPLLFLALIAPPAINPTDTFSKTEDPPVVALDLQLEATSSQRPTRPAQRRVRLAEAVADALAPAPAPVVRGVPVAGHRGAPGAAVVERRGSRAAEAVAGAAVGGPTPAVPRACGACEPTAPGESLEDVWPAEPLQEDLGLGDSVRRLTVLEHLAGQPGVTSTPRARRLTPREANEAVQALVRLESSQLGLGAPHEAPIRRAVQQAGRMGHLPGGARFVLALQIDRAGSIVGSTIEGDGGAQALGEVLAETVAMLAQSPLALGPDERRAGATVTVRGHVVHALPSGAEELVTYGECPKMPLVGGESQPSFFAIGGAAYLEPANGGCMLMDGGDVAALRTIQVRTTVTTTRPGDAPPALTTFRRPPKRKLFKQVQELLVDLANGR